MQKEGTALFNGLHMQMGRPVPKYGYGGIFLVDALQRCRESSEKIGAMAVIIEAKDDNARSFYERFDFRRLEGIESHLFMPMTEISQQVSKAL